MSRYAEQGAEQAYAGLIATPLSMDDLAVRLGRRIRVDAAGQPMMLRLWDPRVLRVLPQSLMPDTLPALLAFGTQALVPDRAGGHEVVALVCPTEDPLAVGQMPGHGEHEAKAPCRASVAVPATLARQAPEA